MAGEIGFAILGTGMVADYHRRAIEEAPGARLVAVGHYDPARFEALSQRFGVPCLSLEDLLEHPEVDAVCLATPSGQHAEQAVAAARAGKHVLVEKPMALTLEDADAMIKACNRAGVKLGVVLQRRTEPLFRRVREAVLAGDLGTLSLGLVTLPYYRPQRYFDGAAWRGTWALDGGGVLMNQGIHLVDLLVWLMGDPLEAQAYAGTLARAIEVEDTLAATLRFPGGALATITATTTAAPGFAHRLELYGTGGGIQIEGESLTRWQLARPEAARVAAPPVSKTQSAGSGGDPRGIAATGHLRVVADFADSIRQDRPPEIGGAEGRRSLAAVRMIYEAAGLPRP
ncbi:oxidoreductase domain protein [Truepera radiovictrix DSM 17093]|uniref:Oxidoreductase domain protein n=1 Tax=Truepera radiovictrix (strain DSM 17093 / CIP 108686 / LMG 22925 / RQ-24) TaxID=649638 RepID=D7CQH8_TRURR|nr:oxidoreductase domain protein [Truepera radiovictrix DSM 17093]